MKSKPVRIGIRMEDTEDFEIELPEDPENESEEEEPEEEEESEVDEEEESEIEEIEEIEEPEEEIIDAPDDSIPIDEVDGGNIADYMTDESFCSKTKKRLRSIQRFYKTMKEVPVRQRMRFDKPSPYLIEHLLSSCTTLNNAAHFSHICPNNVNDVYQLCGKLIQKEFAFSELYNELETKVSGWESKTYVHEKEQERQTIDVMTVKLAVTEGLYQCSRCKSQKTFSRQVQTRSADEGMTSIIQCSECSKVWKEYA